MKILVAIDLSKGANTIIDFVKILSGTFPLNIWLLHVAEPEPDFVGYDVDPVLMRDQTAKKYHEEHNQLQQLSREFYAAGIHCSSLLIQGVIVDTILSEAEKLSIDMIIVGSHKKRVAMTMLTGSLIKDILHKSTIPVLVIPLDEPRNS